VAFYDGRVPGMRAHSAAPNWLDDGGYSLGVCSYAIVSGHEALVYDTHISVPHAQTVRRLLEAEGVRSFRVVLSHWHLDHIAGNEVFADCEIIAHRWTRDEMTANKPAIESGTLRGLPTIAPLVLPTTIYDDQMALTVGGMAVELRHVDIHSRDATMLLLPDQRMLLAGDALEDTVTYVSEPAGFANHLRDLGRMRAWPIDHILPNHGVPERIAAGGYASSLITATERYVERLQSARTDKGLQALSLRDFVAEEITKGWIGYFAPYEAVHRENLAKTLAA
jgi:glyoxylase-like metal-dependent hydrolase (beta-lactamase superfamily II)